MSAQARYTKIIESLVNGQEAVASELLHEAFVEKAREIWSDLVEQDEIVEDDIAEEELDEALGDEESGDFIDDIENSQDEIETEESFGEADEEDEESEMDATGELASDEEADDLEHDFDMDGELDSHEAEHSEVEQKLVSVEDALADLKATFAELMGEKDAEEGDAEDMDMVTQESEFEELDEAAELSKVSVTMSGNEDGKASPVGPGTKEFAADKKPVSFGGGNEKGGKAPTAKAMTVKGPEAGAKLAPAPKPKAA